MRNLLLSALILGSAFQTALGQIVEGQWTYIVQNGGATITASTATGAVTIPSSLGGYAVNQVGYLSSSPVFGYPNSSVTSITIPNSVTSIGSSAFYGCFSLTSVTIPNSVTSIGSYAFYACTSLTSITIPNSVTSIGEYAFSGCSSLTSMNIPNSVISIGSYAFSGCIGLTSMNIPNSVTSIGSYAFYYCSSLTSVTIPNSVTSIENSAFGSCLSLGFVSIPNSVTSIGSGAFSGSGLGSVLLPPNLSPSQISQAGFPSTAVFYVGSVGLPTSMASQADLATTQAQLATTQAEHAKIKTDLANTKTDLSSYFAKFPKFIKIHLPRSPWSKEKK